MLQSRTRQQSLQQVECGCVQPLQVIKEQQQRMLRLGEDADEALQYKLETPACVVGRQVGNWRLGSDDELQFRNDINHEPAVWAEGVTQRVHPRRQIGFACSQKSLDQALECLGKRRIRDVTL